MGTPNLRRMTLKRVLLYSCVGCRLTPVVLPAYVSKVPCLIFNFDALCLQCFEKVLIFHCVSIYFLYAL